MIRSHNIRSLRYSQYARDEDNATRIIQRHAQMPRGRSHADHSDMLGSKGLLKVFLMSTRKTVMIVT